jgi:polysaccharide biosynthesis PFTS motif protein
MVSRRRVAEVHGRGCTDERVGPAVVIRSIPFVTSWLERRGRARVRRMMRGYRTLKRAGQLGRIRDVRDALANATFPGVCAGASPLIFGAGHAHAERITRQYLLVRLAFTELNRALLRALGTPGHRVVHPLPAEWRAVLARQGFAVANIRSALLWHGYVVSVFGRGVFIVARRLLQSLAAGRRPQARLGPYAFFDQLTSANLPRPGEDGRSHDIITWYARWPSRHPDVETLCHGVAGAARSSVNGLPVVPLVPGIPPLRGRRAVLRFTRWAAAAVMRASFDLLRGRWWHAALFSQAVPAGLVRFQTPDVLARDYLFHNSGWLYRPLWTYEAERHGARIAFYFYSTNCEAFKTPDGYAIQTNCWQVSDWPLYVVWDSGQAAFVRRSVRRDANILVAGPIWFSSSPLPVPQVPALSIAVFDVQPWRDAGYQALGLPEEYYTPRTVNAFLQDIHAAVRAAGGTMLLKRKRHVTHWLHPRYIAVVERLRRPGDVVEIDPDASAIRVIEASRAVISLPFTSTALLGRELQKPSIYYDPHFLVQKDDRAAHGIPIISGPAELRQWVSEVLVGDVVHLGTR